MLELTSNSDHRRSSLVALTNRGEAAYVELDVRQTSWANRLAHGIRRSDLETAGRVLDELCRRLEADAEARTR